MRIGRCENYGDIEVAPDVCQAIDESLKTYESLGAEIVALDSLNLMQLNRMAEIVTRCEAATVHRVGLRENWDAYEPQLRRRLTTGLSIPASWYIHALSARGMLLQEFSEAVFSSCDVLMLPTVGTVAPTIDETDVGDSDQLPGVLMQMTGLTRPINYLGLPALAVPAGFNASGLPASFQLVGPPFAESTLFAMGHAYQQATDWHMRAPSFRSADDMGDFARSPD
jgi:aspartyl-tRNA(Asn)/glutamyl-tRNA(Gln) amidotransferase subunit A